MINKNNLSNIDGAEISWFAPLCDGDDDFLGNRKILKTRKNKWSRKLF